jgi:uncharacterized protein (TIGR03086 family)
MPIIETTTTDPRPQFATALATATKTVTAVRPDQLSNPTPCSEFDVRALLGHLVNVFDRITAIGQGENPFALAPREDTEDGWRRAWDEAAAALEATCADDAALDRPSPLPWAPGTGADALTSYVSELTVHTWDVAQATGQDPAWDDDVLAMVAASIGGMPATGRSAIFAPIKATLPPHLAALPDPFVDAVPVAEDAPLIDRIVAWYGRQP